MKCIIASFLICFGVAGCNAQKEYSFARQKSRPLLIVASQTTAVQRFNETNNFNVPVLSCDVTALKTAARANPTLYLMNGPVIMAKWGWPDFKEALK